jgi:hypothetical protein
VAVGYCHWEGCGAFSKGKSGGQISRGLKRLHLRGLVKEISKATRPATMRWHWEMPVETQFKQR